MKKNNVLGLAATQIGINLQLIIIKFDTNNRYTIGPSISETVLINFVIKSLDGYVNYG